MSDTVTIWCQNGKHDWERAKQRGRRPLHCPDHMETESAAPASDPLAKARAAKAKKAQERLVAQKEAKKTELVEVRKSLPKLSEAYDKALNYASKAKTEADVTARFNKADVAMTRLQNTLLRVRKLEAEVA